MSKKDNIYIDTQQYIKREEILLNDYSETISGLISSTLLMYFYVAEGINTLSTESANVLRPNIKSHFYPPYFYVPTLLEDYTDRIRINPKLVELEINVEFNKRTPNSNKQYIEDFVKITKEYGLKESITLDEYGKNMNIKCFYNTNQMLRLSYCVNKLYMYIHQKKKSMTKK